MSVVVISGKILPRNKHISIGLTEIYGIGRSRGRKICDDLLIDNQTKVGELTPAQVQMIDQYIKKNIPLVETDLRRLLREYVSKNLRNRCRRGLRMMRGLPNNGQNTKSNSKTASRLNPGMGRMTGTGRAAKRGRGED